MWGRESAFRWRDSCGGQESGVIDDKFVHIQVREDEVVHFLNGLDGFSFTAWDVGDGSLPGGFRGSLFFVKPYLDDEGKNLIVQFGLLIYLKKWWNGYLSSEICICECVSGASRETSFGIRIWIGDMYFRANLYPG